MAYEILARGYAGQPTTQCILDGNQDMYGIGIRLGFYLQWYGVLLAAWIAPGEVNTMRITSLFLSASTFLAAVIFTAKDIIDPIEIYIILLLNFSSIYCMIPILIWRFATGFDPRWDLTRFPKAKPPSLVYNFLYICLLLAVALYQLWFWIAQKGFVDPNGCIREGFCFGAKNELSTPWFRALNLVFAVLLFLILATLLAMIVITKNGKGKYDDDDWNNIEYRARLLTFQILDSCLRFSVSTIMIAAIEYTISKNQIQGINSPSTAGQLIPLIIGVSGIIRVFYKFLYSDKRAVDTLASPRNFFSENKHPNLEPPRSKSKVEKGRANIEPTHPTSLPMSLRIDKLPRPGMFTRVYSPHEPDGRMHDSDQAVDPNFDNIEIFPYGDENVSNRG